MKLFLLVLFLGFRGLNRCYSIRRTQGAPVEIARIDKSTYLADPIFLKNGNITIGRHTITTKRKKHTKYYSQLEANSHQINTFGGSS